MSAEARVAGWVGRYAAPLVTDESGRLTVAIFSVSTLTKDLYLPIMPSRRTGDEGRRAKRPM